MIPVLSIYKLKNGNLKTVHVGYVKLMYLMLDSFRFLIINKTL